ncbi:hypothetical protein VTN49DRAFT_3377 [Thermomyces lanuginosus]|uniref:uncharacterized protein n=1 Tax=Thermomyces lanuginosus TaxID=5541 RepID=UPI0037439054
MTPSIFAQGKGKTGLLEQPQQMMQKVRADTNRLREYYWQIRPGYHATIVYSSVTKNQVRVYVVMIENPNSKTPSASPRSPTNQKYISPNQTVAKSRRNACHIEFRE